ncbi:hypothetical protein C8Q76DRAFT_794296 [Earliella scabrosa]|nr:hypothetical protein C8Q76DRAFT_794296 [Earliella scabrosa]
MAKSTRSKVKRHFRAKKRQEGVYAVTEAARLQRLNLKLRKLTTAETEEAEEERGEDDMPVEEGEGAGWSLSSSESLPGSAFWLAALGLVDPQGITAESMAALGQLSVLAGGDAPGVGTPTSAAFVGSIICSPTSRWTPGWRPMIDPPPSVADAQAQTGDGAEAGVLLASCPSTSPTIRILPSPHPDCIPSTIHSFIQSTGSGSGTNPLFISHIRPFAPLFTDAMDLDSGAGPSTDASSSSQRISTHGPRGSRREQWRLSKGLPARPKSRGMNRQGLVAAKRKSGRSHRRR